MWVVKEGMEGGEIGYDFYIEQRYTLFFLLDTYVPPLRLITSGVLISVIFVNIRHYRPIDKMITLNTRLINNG